MTATTATTAPTTESTTTTTTTASNFTTSITTTRSMANAPSPTSASTATTRARTRHPAHPNGGPDYSANDGYGYGRPARPAAATLPPLPTIIFPSVPERKAVAPFVPAAPAAPAPTTSTPGKAQVQAGAAQFRFVTASVQSQPRGQRLVQHDADPATAAAETSAIAATQVSTTGPAQLAVGAGVLVTDAVGAIVLVQ
ncbi:hypothetical protein AMAG_19279 [Allomyces macrogynus ATCC 38327]|uniref:Uncharacterized protein n=1 Tax=Allomyces macrogynus (strain ATCC 38327) TaxID=578462 RepID=A0A0L0SQI9_ALLM3|nr:hypothetical protein AMAG_19279 [Allomyces macrogynus ATCC 38327]|eukprot:KNE64776.1 hypothetical protein AMAG_19279 [Allomyces macrogynus ATCC 38327]